MQEHRSKAVMLRASRFDIIFCKCDATDVDVSMALEIHNIAVKSFWNKSMDCRFLDADQGPECNKFPLGNTPKVGLAAEAQLAA